jgi:predicted nucleotidyltransferase
MVQQPGNAPLIPRALLDPVVPYFNPRRIIVFGPVVRGEAGPDSDIDLLVIVDDDTPAERVTLKAGYEARKSYHEPADVIPGREAIFQRNASIAGTPSRAAVLDGVVVYDRPRCGANLV